jgi:hypothetical protein
MIRFHFLRTENQSGVSGTGVAEGVVFSNGKVAIYDDIKTVRAIHEHDGRTQIVWDDPTGHDPDDATPSPSDHPRAPGGGGAEVHMEKREARRDATFRYCERARRVYRRSILASTPPKLREKLYGRPLGYFAKGKSVGCRCRRVSRNTSPKVPGSMCHLSGKYHPCVLERIRGNRMVHAWVAYLRAGVDPDDFDM